MSWGGGGGGADDGAGRERRVDSAAVVASDIRASRCKAAFSISESGNARLLYWFRIAAARPGSGGLAEEEEEEVVDGRRPVAVAAVAADADDAVTASSSSVRRSRNFCALSNTIRLAASRSLADSNVIEHSSASLVGNRSR